MVSIVICSRKVNGKLTKCLDSIYSQTYKPIEIIIETEGSIQQARKRGIQRAKGKYICLVDDDQVLTPHLIQNCVDTCFLGEYDGVTWTERALDPKTFCERVIDYDKELFHSACDDDPIHGAAEPRFFKDYFLKHLDFDKLPPITFELSMINKQVRDMGAKIKFIRSKAYHQEPKTFRELFAKFFRYGYYYIPSLKYSKELVFNHSKPRRVYLNLRCATAHPALYVGLWYHYLVKATAATMGAIWYLLKR